MNSAYYIGILCRAILIIGLGAIFLRIAVTLCNKVAGDPDNDAPVPHPGMLKAMGIVLLTYILCPITTLLICVVIVSVMELMGIDNNLLIQGGAMVLSFSASVAWMSLLLKLFLPTKFGRAFMVAFCFLLVAIVFILVAIAAGFEGFSVFP